MNKPVAVIIGDIHFTTTTLDLASAALYSARNEAWELKVPLIINGDTLDGKAIMRAECVNRLIEILNNPHKKPDATYINVGNHEKINEKSDSHSLHFLKPYCSSVIDIPTYIPKIGGVIVPYFSDKERLSNFLHVSTHKLLIMHQGVESAYLGHYVQDNTSLPKNIFSGRRVISSHYHKKQDIEIPGGMFSYIGNPYTLSFGEALDGPKGYSILYDDYSLELVPLNVRKHVTETRHYTDLNKPIENLNPEDLLYLKIHGPRSLLSQLKTKEIPCVKSHASTKIELVHDDVKGEIVRNSPTSAHELLESLIDSISDSEVYKKSLKALWKDIENS